VSEPDSDDPGAILRALTREIAALAELSGSVRRVVMHAPGHSVEVEWSDNGTRPEPPVVPAPEAEAPEDAIVVRAPLVGTFYTAPQPGAPPFVSEGDFVAKGRTLAIIEAMKLMNPLLAECPGIIEKVLVGNGEPVEFDQPLIVMAQGDGGDPEGGRR